MQETTFGDRVLAFYDALVAFEWASADIALLSPVSASARREALATFCRSFYNDNSRRVFWLGINPSRVRNTSTGVPYTDGYALENYCNIHNDFSKSRELTADFFYRFVAAFGGPERFFSRHYAGAAFPLSVLRKDRYCNWYDSGLPETIASSVPDLIEKQVEMGSNGVLVVIGSGHNAKHLIRINTETNLFRKVLVVEHPRYIAQYKSKEIMRYVDKYCNVAREAEAE